MTSNSQASELTIKSKRSLPALPTEEMPPPFREAYSVPLKHSATQNSGKVIPAPPLPNKSPEQKWAAASARPHVLVKSNHVRQWSMPAVAQPLKDDLPDGQSPSDSTGSSNFSNNTSRLRKDKKQRPQSMQPRPVYTVQAFRTDSGELPIPPVPVEKLRYLEKRVDGFPVAYFSNTLAGTTQLRRTMSKETLGTIFTVGSAEYREETTHGRLQSALPPLPIHATMPEGPTPKPEVKRRYTYQPSSPVPPAPAPPARHRQSLQAIPRKTTTTQQQSQQAFENHITSYDYPSHH